MSFDPRGLQVYADGDWVDGAAASVSLWDHGFLYGDGVFEGLRVFDGALFRPRDHVERFERSARGIGLRLPVGPDELLDLIRETVRRSALRDAHVRPILTRGAGMPGVDPRGAERERLYIAAYPFPPLLGTDPLRLLVSSVVRKAPRSVGAHVKSLNYLDGVIAKQQAAAAGMSDAIMLDHLGAVAECTGANIFAVLDGRLVTPTTRSALPGITRRTVMELFDVEERELWPMELYSAEGAFVTGSGAGIVEVAEIDGRRLPGHPLVAEVADAYRAATRDPKHRVDV